ncbi:MAG TPA: shikimate dehydrogenase [Enteractinococcus sp.]
MTQHTYTAAVLGSPIAHSKSPAMHQAVYRYLGVPIVYDRIEVAEADAAEFFASLPQRFGSRRALAGFSVTMPLKAVLVSHMDHVSQRVQRLGVLNTIVFDEAGVAHGYNTDVDGIRHALAKAGFVAKVDGSMGILGAGGTATAAVAAAAELGLTAVVFYVRNPDRARGAMEVATAYGLESQVVLLDAFAQRAVHHDAVVSTLPAHAADDLALQLPGSNLPPLLDVIYDPWPTVLASAWRASGAHVSSGLDMLLYQGVEQAKLFTKKLVADPQSVDWDTATQHMAAALKLDQS